jgi:hypothetical protein
VHLVLGVGLPAAIPPPAAKGCQTGGFGHLPDSDPNGSPVIIGQSAIFGDLVDSLLRCMANLEHMSRRPARLLSARSLARRVGISPTTVGKFVGEGRIVPDFLSDKETLFNPGRLPALRRSMV